MNKPHYKFNLKELESACLAAYKKWETDMNSPEFRTEIFKTVEDLAFAILSVGKFEKYNLDYSITSYEYALYLFERIITGTFKMIPRIPGTRFPLQEYVRVNVKHVVFTLRKNDAWQDLIQDLEFLLDGPQKPGDFEYLELEDPNGDIADDLMDKGIYSEKLLASLRIFYTYPEIRRLLSISLDMIYLDSKALFSEVIPKDIQDFCVTLVSLSKRLASENNLNLGSTLSKEDLKKVFTSSVRSTVFLSTIASTDFFPRELLLSLDIDSLYRLSHLVGGQTIKIPTIRELDSLLGAVVAVSKVIMEGKEIQSSIGESKNDFKLLFARNINIEQFVSKALNSYNIFNDETSDSKVEPLLNLLATSVKSMDLLFQQLSQRADEVETSSLMKSYVELSSNFSKFTESLISISEKSKLSEVKL